MKNPRIIFSTLSLCLLSIAFLSAQSVSGSGSVIKQERSVKDFTGISVERGIDVFLQMGSTEKVVVEADDNVVDLITTDVRDGILKISLEKGVRNVRQMNVYVTLTQLERIKASSGSDVESEGTLTADRLTIDASSGSDVEIDLRTSELYVNISGGADADLSGETTVLKANASGGSDIMAKNLQAAKVWLDVSGGSDAHVNADEEIYMEASGGSDIYYRGGAKVVRSKASGSSDIHGGGR